MHIVQSDIDDGGLMIFRNILTGLLFVLLITGLGFTQSQEKITLTLEQSVALALEKNPELKIAQKELLKARASVWEAYANILPAISASANFQHAWELQTTRVPNFMKDITGSLPLDLIPGFEDLGSQDEFIEISFGLENTWTYGAMLTQPIFLGGAGIAGVQIANAVKSASSYQLESRRQNLIFQTVNAFYGCLLAEELVQVQEEALKQAQANFNVVQKKYKAGSASGFDKMRAEVEVANLKPEVIAARNTFQSALTGLRTILGLPKDQNIDVKGELMFTLDDMDGITLEEIQGQAASKRPELKAFIAQRVIASKGVVIARSQFLPKLFFSTDYSFLAMRNDYRFTRSDFSKGFTSALSLQIPLFNAFKNHKQYQKAQLDYKIMLDSEKQVQDGIAAEVELSFNQFQVAKEKYQSAKESIGLAEEALRLANLMYDEGVSTQLDVMNSQLALTRARLNHASALYEYQMARYELRRVTGVLHGILN